MSTEMKCKILEMNRYIRIVAVTKPGHSAFLSLKRTEDNLP